MNKIEIYKTSVNQVELQVNLDNDTVWLTQDQMVLLFGRDQSVVSRHIRNVFKEGELNKIAICIFCILQILINQLLIITLMLLFQLATG